MNQESANDQRRKHDRVEAETSVLLICDGWKFPVIGKTVNISEGGYMIVTQYAIREETPLLVMEIHEDGFDIGQIQADPAFSAANVRWCTQMESLNGYAWGLEKT